MISGTDEGGRGRGQGQEGISKSVLSSQSSGASGTGVLRPKRTRKKSVGRKIERNSALVSLKVTLQIGGLKGFAYTSKIIEKRIRRKGERTICAI